MLIISFVLHDEINDLMVESGDWVPPDDLDGTTSHPMGVPSFLQDVVATGRYKTPLNISFSFPSDDLVLLELAIEDDIVCSQTYTLF